MESQTSKTTNLVNLHAKMNAVQRGIDTLRCQNTVLELQLQRTKHHACSHQMLGVGLLLHCRKPALENRLQLTRFRSRTGHCGY
jgi:hypothetical protein